MPPAAGLFCWLVASALCLSGAAHANWTSPRASAGLPNRTLMSSSSWWPHTVPPELLNSNMGTTQQQIIGVPPSWGLGCPTPGSTPPVRAPNNNNDDDIPPAAEQLEERIRRDQHRPHYTCPPPCSLEQTVSAISSDNSASSRPPPPPPPPSSLSSSSSAAAAAAAASSTTDTPENNKRSQHPPYFNQCLHYLKPSVFETLCKKDNQSIYEFGRKVSKLRLPFCCEHSVESVLMAGLEEEYDDNNNNVIEMNEDERHTFTINNHNNNNARSNTINNKEVPVSRRLLRTFECNRHLEALLSLDRLARKAAHLFDAVVERYDCGQTYSVHFQCEDCKDAYRRWVCASLLPYHELRREPAARSAPPPAKGDDGGADSRGEPAKQPERPSRTRRRAWRKVRPCREVCQQVEQRCPFFLPGDRAPGYTTQYAGEPTFLCLDPNIPETGEQLENSSYGPEDCCFRYCDTTESVAQKLARVAGTRHPLLLLTHQKEVRHGVCSTDTCGRPSTMTTTSPQTYSSSSGGAAAAEAERRECSHADRQTCSSQHSTNPPSSLLPPEPPNRKSSFHSSSSSRKKNRHSSQLNDLKNEVVVVKMKAGSGQDVDSAAGRHVRDAAVDSAASHGVRTSQHESFHIHSWTIRQVRRAAGGAIVAPPLASDPTTNIFSDNRLPVLWRRWWSSIFTKIFATAELIAALLPYVLLFLLVQKRAVEGYL
ncbi:uncharacterized protein LOC132205104 [Neocloeon triangulifer]|uniref:uncharacterized protein LOC132205104 n=1 Tax=Neocloeon triangulifer TaxID=2078957 RepID=UPI00286F5A93|nr:uncharacterized protein LOC132205104 [Neocloeon triangulifer]